MGKGCLYMFVMFIVLVVVADSIDQCEKANEPTTSTYWHYNAETGKDEPVTVEKGHEYDYKKKLRNNPPNIVQITSLYYPTREIDSLANKELASGSKSWFWQKGYESGKSAGEKDAQNHTPYKAYLWGSLYNGKGSSDFKLGFWMAYKRYYPEIPKLSNDEVRKRIAEEKEWFRKHQKAVEANKAIHSNSYDEGYKKGYQDGENDGAEKLEYRTSFDNSSRKHRTYRTEYTRGYTDGYEAGYNDYAD